MLNSRALLVKFFCLLVLVAFSNSINAAQHIQAKNVKAFEKINRALQEENYTEGMKLLDELESREGLNNIEKAYIYNFRGEIAFNLDELQASKKWYEKILTLNSEDLSKGLILQTKKINSQLKEVIEIYKPDFQKYSFLLNSLETTDIITEDHYKLALAAYKISKKEEAKAILGRVEELHDSKNVLPEKWLILKADLTGDNTENLKLWQSIVKHYPNKDNKIGLALSLRDNDKIKEAGSIYLELYKQGEFTKESRILVAAYFYREHLEKPLNASLVIAKGFHDKLIEKSTLLKKRLDLFFKEAKKDKTITPQEWLDAGDKFVLYGDKNKAKVCFKKAKKDKALRDVAKQRLKELKQS